MKQIKLSSMAVALAGVFMLSAGHSAMADSTEDLVNALVAKGVLTYEEAAPLMKDHDSERAAQEKASKSGGKIKIAEFIDNATLYGDIRVRAEYRDGSGPGTTAGTDVDENRSRDRYKLVFGIKTTAGDFYTDLALAMGAGGRSDNATFGKTTYNDKEAVFIKRAMVGWNATDWLTLEAGRMANPLYTTSMVWDGDLTFEGLTEKAKFKAGSADVFLTASQVQYLGDKKSFPQLPHGGTTSVTNELLAFQGGARFPITDNVSAKAALTYATFTHDSNKSSGIFKPGIDTSTAAGVASVGVNDLNTIEIPAEINFMAANNIGFRVFGDYVNNLSGNDRADAACKAQASACGKGSDDTAWLLGVGLGSAKDLKTFESNKMAKGDWNAKIWYQDVGVYSVDPNAVDSDFMDSRVNMKGVVFKAQYNVRDNVAVNFAAGHATRKNDSLGTAGAGDLALNLKDFDLYQLDLTYSF
ncbi:MAG TPA: putative porin [Methylophilaceae bacterium]|jgi:polyhydroxyalkanoate synthesis regulator phasin